MKSSKLVCIIPAFNEEKRIEKIIRASKKFVDRVIVVDDGSKDNTSKVSKKSGAKVIRYERNMGVGYATRTGIKEAIRLKPDVVIIIDADGQLDPKYIPEFVKKIKSGYDYVYGFRDLSVYPLDRKIGNFGLTFLTNLICPVGVRDVECGYRAIDIKSLKKMRLKAIEYEREMDFIYEVWRNNLKIDCVKIKVKVFFPKRAIVRGFKNFAFLLKRRLKL